MPSQQDVVRQWLQRVLVPYPSSDLVASEVLAALDRYPTLSPKTDAYTHDTGHTQLLLLLHGTLPITYRSKPYHIPIHVWLPLEYPRKAPMAYVVPTRDMAVRKSAEVDPGGRVGGAWMDGWERQWEKGRNVNALLEYLQELFSGQPPVFAKAAQVTAAASGASQAGPGPSSAAHAAQAQQQQQQPAPPPRPRSMLSDGGYSPVSAHGPGPARHESLPVYTSRPPPPRQPPPPPLPASPIRGNTGPPTSFASPQAPLVPPHPASPGGAYRASPPPGPNGYTRPPGGPPAIRPGLPVYDYGYNSIHGPQAGSPVQAQPPQVNGQPPYAQPPRPPQIATPQPPPSRPQPRAAPVPDLLSANNDEGPSPTAGTSSGPPPARPLPPATLHLHSLVHAHLNARLDPLMQHLAGVTRQLESVRADVSTGEPAIRDEMARLEAVRGVCASVGERMGEVVRAGEARIEEIEARGEPGVDEVVCGISIVHNQLIDLVAEDNAIEDTIYHVARALDAERIDLDRALKQIRILAREQYQKRALIERIEGMLAGQGRA